MEGRLGADFSDVRVHTDATADRAAESVGARAFTAGSHIAFRRGRYAPASAEGRHTLAHELTHVLQQRSGPVDGNGAGIRVSDPSDRFERAAQAGAQRALAGHRPIPEAAPHATGPVGGPVTPAGAAVTVQRAVGYEYELMPGASDVLYAEGTRKGSKKSDSKGPLVFLDAAGQITSDSPASPYRGRAYISSDNGNVEYVTGPLDTEDQVKDAVGGIVAFHKQFTTSGDENHTRAVVRGVDGETYRIMFNSRVPDARPQATIGIALQHVLSLFAKLGDWSKELDQEPQQEPAEEQGRGKRRLKKTQKIKEFEEERKKRRKNDKEEMEEEGTGPRAEAEAKHTADEERKALANAKARVVSKTSVHTDQATRKSKITVEAMEKAGVNFDAAEREKVLGFLAIIFKTTLDAAGVEVDESVDAKYYFSLMPRTDFISMFYSMDLATRTKLKLHLIGAVERTQPSKWLDQDVLKGYKGTEKVPGTESKVWKGPVRRKWLESILNGSETVNINGRTVPDKDALSPPPGYPPHSDPTRKPEGMGAMERDLSYPELSLFELRGLWMPGGQGGYGPLPVNSWLPLALVVYQLVQEATASRGAAPAGPADPGNQQMTP